MRRAMLVGAALLFAASTVRADLGPRPAPGPFGQPPGLQRPQAKIKVNIEVDEKATEPRLIIPMQVMFGGAGFGGGAGALGVPPPLGQAGAPPLGAVGVPPGGAKGQGGGLFGAPPGAKPPGEKPPPKKEEDGSAPQASLPLPTVVIGMALALSLSTGGLWVVRRKTNQPGGGLTPLLLVTAFLTIAAIGTATVSANKAAPPRPPQVAPGPGLGGPQVELPGPLPALLKMEGVRVDIVPQGDTVRLILPKKHKEQLQKGQKEEKEKPKNDD